MNYDISNIEKAWNFYCNSPSRPHNFTPDLQTWWAFYYGWIASHDLTMQMHNKAQPI
jgi:hypothetical protein